MEPRKWKKITLALVVLVLLVFTFWYGGGSESLHGFSVNSDNAETSQSQMIDGQGGSDEQGNSAVESQGAGSDEQSNSAGESQGASTGEQDDSAEESSEKSLNFFQKIIMHITQKSSSKKSSGSNTQNNKSAQKNANKAADKAQNSNSKKNSSSSKKSGNGSGKGSNASGSGSSTGSGNGSGGGANSNGGSNTSSFGGNGNGSNSSTGNGSSSGGTDTSNSGSSGSNNSGGTNNSNVNDSENAEGDDDGKIQCSISISCVTLLDNLDSLTEAKKKQVPKDGVILKSTTVKVKEGSTVFDVLSKVTTSKKIHLEYSYTPAYKSYYIEGIHNLYEFDAGELSGWMYSVNGEFLGVSCSSYNIKDGDVIQWVYTCNLGKDVGSYFEN
jgi:hypothetical protein